MKENAKETKVLFDKDVLATRIYDLRTGDTKKERTIHKENYAEQ